MKFQIPNTIFGVWLCTLVCHVSVITSSKDERCWGTDKDIVVMTPDYDIEVGSTLEINCTLLTHNVSNTFVNSSDLIFKFGKGSQNVHQFDSKSVRRINEKTALLRIENATANYSGSYYCYVMKNLSDGEDLVDLACLRAFNVGYKPRPVENFTCTSYEKKNLTCTWKPLPNPVKTEYELKDNIYYPNCSLNGTIRKCSDKPSVNTSCTMVEGPTQTLYRKGVERFCFILVSNNSLGRYEERFEVNHNAIIKFSSCRDFQVKAVSSYSVTVEWKIPVEFNYHPSPPLLTYEITYRLYGNETSPWRTITVNSSSQIMTKMITGLLPYTRYQINIRCRAAEAIRDDIWSPSGNIIIQTKPDVPTEVPEIIPQAYKIEKNDNSRRIFIYWKPVPEAYHFGPDFAYTVEVFRASAQQQRLREPRSAISEPTSVVKPSIKFDRLDINAAYEFRIRSKNSEGVSNKYSSIVVNKNVDVPSPPAEIFVLSVGKGKYEITWSESASKQNVISYTLFWCKSELPGECNTNIDWTNVTERSYNLNLTNDSYQFGIAANFKQSTSGIKWANCIRSVKEVIQSISLKAEPVSPFKVKLIWTLNCKSPREDITNYRITYCKTNKTSGTCKDFEKHLDKTVNKDTESLEIEGLDPFTDYRIILTAKTSVDFKPSLPVIVKTLPSAPDDPPRDVSLRNVTDGAIALSWAPSSKLNGNITHYEVFYSDPSNASCSKHYQHNSSANDSKISAFFKLELCPYKNYTIQIASCYKNMCSPKSKPIYYMTEIASPGRLPFAPFIDKVNDILNVSWDRPSEPNGPIDHYVVYIGPKGNDTEHNFIFNTTLTYQTAKYTCSEDGSPKRYYAWVQPVNKRGNILLRGPLSDVRSISVCSDGVNWKLIIGVTTGIAIGLLILIIALFYAGRKMKVRINEGRIIIVKLPPGLDSPTNETTQSFTHCKKDMSRQNSEESSSSYPFFKRFGSMIGVDRLLKYRHGSGNSQSSTTSADALIGKPGRPSSCGIATHKDGSEGSTSGHDSVSSSITNKTHLSCDSGTELDIQPPPSPDNVFSDIFQTGSHPLSKSCKLPSLPKVDELGPVYGSKDSGIGKGDVPEKSGDNENEEMLPYAIFAPYIKAKNSDVPPHSSQPPYSKVMKEEPNTHPYLIRQNNAFAPYDTGLANSEPSLFDTEGISEEPVDFNESLPPYLKFPFAKSLGNVSEVPSVNASNSPGAYSKFAIAGPQNDKISASPYNIRPYSKFGIRRQPFLTTPSPYVTSDTTVLTKPIQSSLRGNFFPTVNAATINTAAALPHNGILAAPYSKIAPGVHVGKKQSSLDAKAIDDGENLEESKKAQLLEESSAEIDAKAFCLPPCYSKLKVLQEEDESPPPRFDSNVSNQCSGSEPGTLSESELEVVLVDRHPNQNADDSKDKKNLLNKSGYVAHSDVAKADGISIPRPVVSARPKQGYVPHETAFNILTTQPSGDKATKSGNDALWPSSSSRIPEAKVEVDQNVPHVLENDLSLECSGLLVNNSDDDQSSDYENHELTHGDSSKESQVLVPLKPSTAKNGYVSLGELHV